MTTTTNFFFFRFFFLFHGRSVTETKRINRRNGIKRDMYCITQCGVTEDEKSNANNNRKRKWEWRQDDRRKSKSGDKMTGREVRVETRRQKDK